MALAGSGLTAWTMDRELRYTWMENPALGFDLAAVIGRTDAELMPADVGITLTALKRRVIEQDETVAAEVSVALEQETKWFSVTAQPLHDDSGAVIGLAGQSTDVTERRLAELELGRMASEAVLSERRLSGAQRIAHLGSFTFDVGSGELTWSTEYYRILGIDPSLDPSVDLFMSRVHPDDVSTVARGWIDATERGLPFDIEIRIVGPEAADRKVRVCAVPERAVDGAILAVAGTMMDQTDLARAVEVRKAAEMRFETGFEQTAVGAMIAGLDGVSTRVNLAACVLLGRSRESLVGRAWREHTHPDDLQLGELALASLAAGHDTYQDERRFVRPDASVVWASVHVTLVRDEAGEPQYFFVHLQDITRRKRIEDELAHQALHDSLTGLPNRALLADRLERSLALSQRKATRVGVLFLDLDHFKVVNDSLGHTVGDEVLRLVGERFTAAIRPGDTVARFGGDEFVIVSDDISILECQQIAKRLLDALAVPYLVADHELNVTASVGIAIGDASATPESLLRDSDTAMYRAKERGRGRIEMYDVALRANAEERIVTAAALHHALERQEFRLHYQPIVDLATEALTGVEALLRWEHPDGHIVSPNEFIPLAEDTGLIVPIGAWVLERACLQLVDWLPASPSLSMSVNLSVRQMLAPNIITLVEDVLQRTGAPANRLCLELTESVFMEDADYFGRTLAALKEIGLRLAIDDFGIGYSSLSYLKRFPVDAVKVDRSFVDGLGVDPNDSALVAAIIAMAAALDLAVTAEGIETSEQLEILKALECHRAQGFYFARPMVEAAITPLVTDSRHWADHLKRCRASP